MAKKKQTQPMDQPRMEGTGPGLPPGVKLLHTLEGDTTAVMSVAFGPRGDLLASGSDNASVRLWDVQSGAFLRTLGDQHTFFRCVAFDPEGNVLASANPLRLWDVHSGKRLHTSNAPKIRIDSLAFDPRGKMLAVVGDKGSARLWEIRTGKRITIPTAIESCACVAFHPRVKTLAIGGSSGVELWELRGDEPIRKFRMVDGDSANIANGIAFDPSGKALVSGGGDGALRVWDVQSGKLLRMLEGHSSIVDTVAFSPDGRMLATKSNDDTIRLWDPNTWDTIAVIPAYKEGLTWVPSLAFHPTRPLLAATDSVPDTSDESRGRLIRIWELDHDVLLGNREATSASIPQRFGDVRTRTVHYTTAKIVLVGDSGVGKTGLGWRLSHGAYREHDSTHGQQFWVLDQLSTARKDGTRCEAVLWDLAGQPDYRLIHALSIQDADLALILFDPTNSRDPLGSAEYWLQQLPPECPKILVAARVDRGHPVLTNEELEKFCQRFGIRGGWLATSAASGLGLDELLARMKQAIPWDDKPAISTDAVFKRIKDFVLALKESPTRKQIIFTAAELRSALAQHLSQDEQGSARAEPPTPLTDAHLLTAARHLASQGFVRLLALSSGEERVLLVPELMNNLAASMVLEARRNPRGLGAVEERRLFDNSYRFRELEAVSEADQALLLDGTVTAFLANRLSYRCFRESWAEMSLLVFPDLMNVRKPEREDLVTEEGPSYILTGATENTFAGLVVLLGYTNLFLRTDQAHDVAWFASDHDELSGVRQLREDDARTLVLLFSQNVREQTRAVFEGLVEQMLSRREVGVRRLRPIKCSRCHTPVDRAVMARRLKSGKPRVFCEECAAPIVLPPDEPLAVKPAEQATIAHEGAVAERRTRFEGVIFELHRFAQERGLGAPTCFVSYAWGNADHERWVVHRLALDLEKAGLIVVLDRWDNAHPGASVPRFLDRIEKAGRVLVVGTQAYREKYENKNPQTGTVVAAEMDLISARLLGREEQKATVVPLLLEGDPDVSFPPALRTRVWSDFRDDDRYFDTALDLLLGLYRVSPREPAVAHWKERLGSIR